MKPKLPYFVFLFAFFESTWVNWIDLEVAVEFSVHSSVSRSQDKSHFFTLHRSPKPISQWLFCWHRLGADPGNGASAPNTGAESPGAKPRRGGPNSDPRSGATELNLGAGYGCQISAPRFGLVSTRHPKFVHLPTFFLIYLLSFFSLNFSIFIIRQTTEKRKYSKRW